MQLYSCYTEVPTKFSACSEQCRLPSAAFLVLFLLGIQSLRLSEIATVRYNLCDKADNIKPCHTKKPETWQRHTWYNRNPFEFLTIDEMMLLSAEAAIRCIRSRILDQACRTKAIFGAPWYILLYQYQPVPSSDINSLTVRHILLGLSEKFLIICSLPLYLTKTCSRTNA